MLKSLKLLEAISFGDVGVIAKIDIIFRIDTRYWPSGFKMVGHWSKGFFFARLVRPKKSWELTKRTSILIYIPVDGLYRFILVFFVCLFVFIKLSDARLPSFHSIYQSIESNNGYRRKECHFFGKQIFFLCTCYTFSFTMPLFTQVSSCRNIQ